MNNRKGKKPYQWIYRLTYTLYIGKPKEKTKKSKRVGANDVKPKRKTTTTIGFVNGDIERRLGKSYNHSANKFEIEREKMMYWRPIVFFMEA